MSDQFIEFAGAQMSDGIYYEPTTKKYTSVLSDLFYLDFDRIEDLRDWLLHWEDLI